MKTKWNWLGIIVLLAMLVAMNTSAAQAEEGITMGPETLPDSPFGVSYSQQLTATGGAEPYTFSLMDQLPGGFQLDATGLLHGGASFLVETVPGTYSFTVQVQDGSSATATHAYTLNVVKGTPNIVVYASRNGMVGYPIVWNQPFQLSALVMLDSGNGSVMYLKGKADYYVDDTPVPGCQAVDVSEMGYTLCEAPAMGLDIGDHTFEVDYQPPAEWDAYFLPASQSGTFTVEAGSYAIGGTLFQDRDRDGEIDSDEYGLYESWTVNLDQGCDDSVDFTTTSNYGNYQFSNMPGGQCYRLSEVIGSPGWTQTSQPADFWLDHNIYYGLNFGNFYPTISFSPTVLPNGTKGVEYNQQITASGGTGPYTYTLENGSLSAGLTFSETGLLSGTPTVTTSYNRFWIKAEDANHAVGDTYYNLVIKANGVFTFTSSSNPSAPGDPVTFTISATGDGTYYGTPMPPIGNVSFYADGTLIAGCSNLSLNRAYVDGKWTSGNFPVSCETSALETGTHQITATYSDLYGVYNTPTLALEQVVEQRVLLTIGPETLADAVFEKQYSQQLTASDGVEPYTFSLTSGSLPNGISLSSDGLLSGRADYYGGSTPGNYPITVQVQDANSVTASRAYTLVMDKATPTVTVHASRDGMSGTPIVWKHPFTLWANVKIDTGLGWSTNVFSAGTASFSVDGNPVPGCQAVDSNAGLPVCRDISMELALGAHTFQIDYSPTEPQNYYLPSTGSGTFTVETGSYGIAGILFRDNDRDGAYGSEDSSLYASGWTINLDKSCDETTDYTATTNAGGYFEFSSIPGADCYRITEVPAPGWQQTTQFDDFWLSESDYYIRIGNYYPTITVSPQGILPNGSVGVEYSQTFTASGGTGPYKFTLSDGTLPAGLALSEDGVLSGTPTAGAKSYFSIKAEDANHAVGNGGYQLYIKTDAVFTFTSSASPSAPGDPVTFTFSGTGTVEIRFYNGPFPPIGPVTFSADGEPIEGCSDVGLNVDPDGNYANYPATCTTATLTQGTHQITAVYTDNSGFYHDKTLTLTQVVKAPDSTEPVITPTVTGTLGSNGWYTSDVSLSWAVTDDESTVSFQSGCDPATITTDQQAVDYVCTATSAGGTASKTVSIKRDATKPAVALIGVEEGATYTLGAVPQASCSATDAISEVAIQATVALTGGDAWGVGDITATCSGATDNAGNAADSVSVQYSVNAASSADLSLTKVDNKDPVKVGAQLVYTLTVNNLGPNVAQSITLVDTLDRNTKYVSVTAPKGWSCRYASGKVTCTSASLASGASAVVKITVSVSKTAKVGKDLVNSATVSSPTYDPVMSNNTTTQKTLVSK